MSAPANASDLPGEMSAAEYLVWLETGQAPASKYRNEPTVVDGIRFDSIAEATHYGGLKLLERSGVIKDLQLQPRFDLCVNGLKVCTYVADFSFVDVDRGVVRVQDVKGYKTDVYRLKARLMKACLGIEIEEIQ